MEFHCILFHMKTEISVFQTDIYIKIMIPVLPNCETDLRILNEVPVFKQIYYHFNTNVDIPGV